MSDGRERRERRARPGVPAADAHGGLPHPHGAAGELAAAASLHGVGGTRTRLKVCCIASLDEARTAVACGADAVGLVSAMPSGPGVIDEARIAEVAARVPPPVATFLLTSRHDAGEIAAQARRCRVDTVQLVDELPDGTYDALRAALPGVRLVQVVHVLDDAALLEAAHAAAHVDALLLDSGNPRLAVKELGGTGRIHDWSLSRRIRDAVSVPVFLAGGLRADNVADAVRTVRPFGVDVCSGVRTGGRLDAGKLAAFAAALRAVDAELSAADHVPL